jgi:hypothetical protein
VRNEPPIHTTKPYRHVPNKETLVDILRETDRHQVIGMVHFELHKSWPGTPDDGEQVLELLQYLASHDLRPPLQLNGIILPDDIQRIHREGGIRIVLQLRKELVARGEAELLHYISTVSSAISTILMDPSAGAGAAIDLAPALAVMREIEAQRPNMFHFGFAGGLGGSNHAERALTTDLVGELSGAIPDGAFSVDAETKIRAMVDGSETDRLDLSLCSHYFQAVRAGLVSR